MEDRVRDRTASDAALGGWVESETRDLADATLRRLDDAKRDVKEYASQAREYVQGAVDQTRTTPTMRSGGPATRWPSTAKAGWSG
jgi:hypothetical protein